MFSRRSFLGSLFASAAGFFGFKTSVKAEDTTSKSSDKVSDYLEIEKSNQIMRLAEFKVYDVVDGKRIEVSRDHDLVRLLRNPNRQDLFSDLMVQWNTQLELTGMALTWMVPNVFGVPFELYPIPTEISIPQPFNSDYPDGYWRIQPVYPYGPYSRFPAPLGPPIPAQWMLRFKYPNPIIRDTRDFQSYRLLASMRSILPAVKWTDELWASSINRDRWVYRLSIKPKLKYFSQQLTRHLAPFFGENLVVEIDMPKEFLQ